jgi:hypothetical protein
MKVCLQVRANEIYMIATSLGLINESFIGESVPQMKEALENVVFSESSKFDEVH